MSNESLRQANNIKAGIFVTVSLIIGLVVIFLLGDLWTLFFGSPMTRYSTSYTVRDGVSYLQAGSGVRIGGISLGKVDSVTLDETKTGPIKKIDVEFSIPTGIPLYSNAVATIQSGLISADSYISFSSLGFDEPSNSAGRNEEAGELLKPGGYFVGKGSAGILGALVGAEGSDSIELFLDSIASISGRLREDGYVLKWVLGAPSALEIQDLVRNADLFVADFQRKWDESWSAEVDSIVSNLESSVANLDEVISQNQESFYEIVENVRSVTQEANATWKPQLTAIFADGKTTLDNVDVMIADLKSRSPLMFDNFGDTLAQLNVASLQLNRAIAEVSANPWRLLYRPTDKEYSNELLYEAARNFSFGAADLKSAAGSMQRLLDARGDRLGSDDEDLLLIRRNLVESFQRYERAQQQLMEILRGEGTGSAPAKSGGS
ncbi:MAG: MlaD family protein [Phycisphaerales bacterium]|nr:MlaD family protein [Phycisphaerales bacterium]